MNSTFCRVCGRPVEKTARRGRPKAAHTVCIALESRTKQLLDLLEQMKWQDAHHRKRFRGDLFSIVNGPLHPYSALICPDDSEDAPIQTRASSSISMQENPFSEEATQNHE